MTFYTYLWLREDGTPYYVGKGKGRRAFERKMHRQNPPAFDRIILLHYQTEHDAINKEIELIAHFGRKDINTGCLRNLTDGGDGLSGHKMSEETRCRMRLSASKIHTEEHNLAVSMALKGRKCGAPKPHTLETRSKLSAIAKQRGTNGVSFTGRKHSEESKAKISLAAAKKRWARQKEFYGTTA